jgi:ketosteroid isomerase-like protein
VRRFFETIGELLEFESFDPQAFLADGDRVVVLGVDTVKVKRGSDRSFTESWAHVFTLRNGTIVAFQEYLNLSEIAEEIRQAAARV